ncbi:MAG: hypothetical protein C4589_02250 [Peptococcaceae bacterium]|nr:MAG: hypothetical protein C4589_02250 [Peptococcaceae bacterium]
MPANAKKKLELAEGIYRNTRKQFNLLQGEIEEDSLLELLSLLAERGSMMELAAEISEKDGPVWVKKEINELLLKTWELDRQNSKIVKNKRRDIINKLKDLHSFKKGPYISFSRQMSGAFIDQKK